MLNTMWAIVRDGKIELLERADIPDGARVLVTFLPEELDFRLHASEISLSAVWNNAGDDVYEQLLDE